MRTAFLRLLAVSTLAFVSVASQQESRVSVSPSDLRVLVGGEKTFEATVINPGGELNITVNHEELLEVVNVTIIDHEVQEGNEVIKLEVTVRGIKAGHAAVSVDAPSGAGSFVTATILKNNAIYYVSAVVGWVYFAAWSVSFYPQIYENWRRKSVVGLNFDFLALNIVGFSLYSLFNCGLYWIEAVENQYFERYPKGHNPVMINDIVFALHAVAATLITITQCFFFERANQRVSIVAKIILGVYAVFLEISYLLAGIDVIIWLDFLNYCSYVKLSTTLIKYIPQAYMNYRRKSTVGWSIGNIILDLTGGSLSMLQMILNAHNYNDWESIFGDPTKFGMGLFSVLFDIFFIVQHYILYRHPQIQDVEKAPNAIIDGSPSSTDVTNTPAMSTDDVTKNSLDDGVTKINAEDEGTKNETEDDVSRNEPEDNVVQNGNAVSP